MAHQWLLRTFAVFPAIAGLGKATRIFDGASNLTAFHKSESEILAMPLKRFDHRGVVTPSVAKRYFGTDILGVYGAAYLAEITIGTSTTNQTVDVLIDTGSFELWVDPDCAASNVPDYCTAFGSYDPTKSSSSQNLNSPFQIKYGSGSTSGTYYKDDVRISGARIQGQQFGVANMSDAVWFGIMGLGYGQGNGFIDYPLVVDSLYSQGYTNSKLFSLDLGGQPAPGAAVTGEMVFGGVDTNKYSGNLARVPIDTSDPHYKITLVSIKTRKPSTQESVPFVDNSLPLPVILDSGTTLSLLPQSLVAKLAAQFPGATSDGNGGYKVSCSYQSQDGTVDFGFAADGGRNVTINVAYRDFIWNSGGDCFLGAWYSADVGVYILGDTFLRAAYVSFDQSNDAVYMSNYISCGGSNLVPVPAGPDGASNIAGNCPSAAGSTGGTGEPPVSPVSSATLPGGSVSSTVLPSAAGSLGPTLNPVKPASISSSATNTPIPSGTPSSPLVGITRSSSSPSFSPTSPSDPNGPNLPGGNNNGDGNGDGSSDVGITMTTVPLNNPTNSPPGAPAIGDPSRGADVDRIGVASTGAATITVASTITRELTYTLDGKVATSTRIITATFCPEHETVDREGYVIQKTAKTEPASTMVAPAQITAAPAALGVNLNGKDSVLAVTEHCSASTHVVTFCDAQDDSCTVGMITTEVVTMLETVLAAANPTTVAAQLADATTPVIFSSTSTDMRDNVLPAGNSEDSTAPGMPPTTIVPGVGFVPTYGAGSNSSMGIAGVSGSVSAVVGETIETTGPVMVAGAADNRCVDSWFVKLIFAVVAGLLVLLEV